MKSWVSLSGILQRTPERIPGSERRSPQGPTREEQTTITITWHCTEATATMQVDRGAGAIEKLKTPVLKSKECLTETSQTNERSSRRITTTFQL
jgi:hypothetical protein